MINSPFIKIILITLSGYILSLSMPGYDLWFIAWIGLVPLFIIINTSKEVKDVILYSFLFGFSYNLSCLYWLITIYPLNWMGFNDFQSRLISITAVNFAPFVNALYFVLFALCVFLVRKYSLINSRNGIIYNFIITFLWLLVFNKLSAVKFLLGFPWTLIEYSQYKNLYLIQMAEYFGSMSVSFLIVFCNAVLADFLIWKFNIEKIGSRYIPKDPGVLMSILISAIFIFVFIGFAFGSGLYLFWKSQKTLLKEPCTVCVLQGNLPIKSTRGHQLNLKSAKETYGMLIENNQESLFIAPEGALPVIFTRDYSIQDWLKKLSLRKKAGIIFGSYAKVRDKYTNCAVYSPPSGTPFSFYEKERLVPFGEFVPAAFLLPEALKKLAQCSFGKGFGEGDQKLPLNTNLGKVGITICFEMIFPQIPRKRVLDGADILVNLSDLSWFSNTFVKRQFLSFAVFRAVESRRPVIISSNSGISAFISPTGRIQSQSIPDNEGVLIDQVIPNNKLTFYTKYGW